MDISTKRREKDLTNGPMFKSLFFYALPFVFANVLQVLFNTADIAVLGIFVGDNAVAAVGANSSLSNLLVGLFVGFSAGTNVVLARYVGAKNMISSQKVIGTSICLALISGFLLMAIGVPFAEQFLIFMGCDQNILGMATTYLRIYFLGMPIMMLYNFCASILRATGDSKRPLIYLLIGGVANVILNVFFVVVCNMTVEGVAIATVVSQLIATILSFIRLFSGDSEYAKLNLKYLRIYKEQLKEICIIGIPTSLQNLAFNASNVLIQSKVNSFEAVGMSANTAAQQFDAIVYNIGNAVSMSCMAFVGQNVGAKKIDRIKKGIFSSLLLCVVLQFSVGITFALFSPVLTGIVLTDEVAIKMASIRIWLLSAPYFLAGFMEVFANSIRAMGKPFVSLVTSVLGAVVFRIIFLEVTFFFSPQFSTIFLSYPVSWTFTCIVYIFMIRKVYKDFKMKIENNQIDYSN